MNIQESELKFNDINKSNKTVSVTDVPVEANELLFLKCLLENETNNFIPADNLVIIRAPKLPI